MGRLEGKVAIVTGAGRGMGRAHAVALAEEGADLVLADIEGQLPAVEYELNAPGDLEETAALVGELGGRCLAELADVRDLAAMEALAARAREELGRIDVMVANAGTFASARVHEMTSEQWDTVLDVDLTGVFNSIRAVAPTMVVQGSGRIVAISSVAGRAGYGNLANYCAAKWGVIGLIKAAAIDLGPHNVTVNAVCPGQVDTPLLDNDALLELWFPEAENPTAADMDELILTTMHHIPVPRLEPREVSKAVVFLASEEARYVSGTTIDVSAGMAANYTA